MTFGGGNNRSFRSRIAGMDFETLLWIMGGMMASIVIFSGATVFVRRLGYFSGKPGLKFDQELTEILAKIDQRQHGEGLMDYARRISGQLPNEKAGLGGSLVKLSKMITSLRFDKDDATPERNREIAQAMREFTQALKAKA